jgi:hypothetical protein
VVELFQIPFLFCVPLSLDLEQSFQSKPSGRSGLCNPAVDMQCDTGPLTKRNEEGRMGPDTLYPRRTRWPCLLDLFHLQEEFRVPLAKPAFGSSKRSRPTPCNAPGAGLQEISRPELNRSPKPILARNPGTLPSSNRLPHHQTGRVHRPAVPKGQGSEKCRLQTSSISDTNPEASPRVPSHSSSLLLTHCQSHPSPCDAQGAGLKEFRRHP